MRFFAAQGKYQQITRVNFHVIQHSILEILQTSAFNSLEHFFYHLSLSVLSVEPLAPGH